MSTLATSHVLKPVGGTYVDGAFASLQVKATVSTTVVGAVVAGHVCHLIQESGAPAFIKGVHDRAVPVFIMSPDSVLATPGSGTSAQTDAYAWRSVAPDGNIFGFVATGGFELESTEYDDAQTYDPTVMLTADASGVLTPGLPYVVSICGVTHKKTNVDGTRRGYPVTGAKSLRFWSMFLPRLPKATVTSGALTGTLLT